MNKAYKVVYNESTGTYVAVSEIETSQGKSVQSQVSCVPQAEAKRPIRKIHAFSKLTLTLLGVFTSLAMPFAHASYAAGGDIYIRIRRANR
ncbi:ESPR domain-containing protein [Vitreoscilla massiliensis]|uniref:ESPR domain-containing protein n=1 Tax=Vitreoscilla massiliensis TaxID=1689272 RepID=A0ABY4DZP4_9NEIS|nr:ESPR domain-containing protein [Vitreoscilla massiliensis]UOO88581.1 ESPR domain-containing protein [Vitreoscilla massiliensis]